MLQWFQTNLNRRSPELFSSSCKGTECFSCVVLSIVFHVYFLFIFKEALFFWQKTNLRAFLTECAIVAHLQSFLGHLEQIV